MASLLSPPPSASKKEAPVVYRSSDTRRKRIPNEWVAEQSDFGHWAKTLGSLLSSQPIHNQARPVASNVFEQEIAAEDKKDGPELGDSSSLTGEEILAIFDVEGHWSGKGQHVEFVRKEELPVETVKSLGRGASADVDEVTCKGVALARKRIFCGRRMRIEDVRQELDILKRLNHKHIIILIGSYTQKNILGLLLYPAAVCDLGMFLDELDEQQKTASKEIGDGLSQVLVRLGVVRSVAGACGRLLKVYGCLTNAVKYLHENGIRHKDLKPSNILLDPNDGLFLTDFGISRDFSDSSTSVTMGTARGTYKYCAPEVARWEPRGRAADIFSLGCVFLQIETVYRGLSLLDFELFRIQGEDQSFQNSPDKLRDWILSLRSLLLPRGQDRGPHKFLDLIGMMLEEVPTQRLGIGSICEEICAISALAPHDSYFGRCCDRPKPSVKAIGVLRVTSIFPTLSTARTSTKDIFTDLE